MKSSPLHLPLLTLFCFSRRTHLDSSNFLDYTWFSILCLCFCKKYTLLLDFTGGYSERI